MTRRETILMYLDSAFTEPIRDPLWMHIYLAPEHLRLVNSAEFHKLDRIKQLGIAHLVYPGATHTRLAHSLGVYHIARRILRKLLAHDGLDFATLEGVKAFLIAALLHDLGHYPFTHSLKELPLRQHEELTAEGILSSGLAGPIKDGVGVDPAFVAAIVDHSLPARGEREIPFFRKLLSGVLDPDKLDYLNRDAYFCGVPYGIQDIDFVISRIRPVEERGLVVETQGTHAIETVLFAKYLMYRSVYWHKTVRVATAMIKKALYLGMRDGRIKARELYGLDDETFFSKLGRRRFPQFRLVRRVAERDILRCAWEAPFDESDPRLAGLDDLELRSQVEERLARLMSRRTGLRVSSLEVVIDVPERISFDADLHVLTPDGRCIPYADSDTVFSRGVVADFTRSIRVARIAAPRSLPRELDLGALLAEAR